MLTDAGSPGVATTATTIEGIVARLEQIARSLPVSDGVACFNRMYLTVTRLVQEHLVQGTFTDPVAMHTLDVTFANLYLSAVDADLAGSPVPEAWAPLFARRADPGLVPIQFALAGMNAHIKHDLPLAVADNRAQEGSAPEQGSFHGDYLRVNALALWHLRGLPAVRDAFGAALAGSVGLVTAGLLTAAPTP